MQELQNLTDNISNLLEQLLVENTKHMNGNASAGQRARKISLEMKKICATYKKVSLELDKFRKKEATTKKK